MTLRIGDVLVAVAGDTDAAVDEIHARFGAWIDTTHHGIDAAFDLRLDTGASVPPGTPNGAPRTVPQLRYGGTLLARSRSAADVVDALDAVLGGVLAHHDHAAEPGVRVFLRPFVVEDRVVLVDADPPMLVNDPMLARSGIVELPTWSVAVEPGANQDTPPMIHVAAPLSSPTVVGRFELAGIVGVLRDPPAGDAGLLARYATRHPSPEWFRTVHALIEGQRLLVATDRADARSAITRVLA